MGSGVHFWNTKFKKEGEKEEGKRKKKKRRRKREKEKKEGDGLYFKGAPNVRQAATARSAENFWVFLVGNRSRDFQPIDEPGVTCVHTLKFAAPQSIQPLGVIIRLLHPQNW